MATDWAPNIFEYLDYREYLRDYYEAGKANVDEFSYRYLARKAGFSSPNFFKLVMDGDRNLSADSVQKFAKALVLDGEETRFFADLVAFNQTDEIDEKNAAFERLSASRRFRQARRLDSDMFHYLSYWYYPAIREMAARPDFVAEPDWIAERLFPKVDVAQVEEALDVLLEMGLLVREDDGSITRGDPSLTTGHEVRSLAIGNYHRQMLHRAAESIQTVPSERRDISALTVCISSERVEEIKAEIHAFRERLLNLSDSDEAPEHVYQLNIQLFPMTDVDES